MNSQSPERHPFQPLPRTDGAPGQMSASVEPVWGEFFDRIEADFEAERNHDSVVTAYMAGTFA